MLVRFNKRTIVGGTIYTPESGEVELANDIADQVVAAGNGVVVGFGAYSNEASLSTDANGNTVLVGASANYDLTVTPSAATGAAIQAAINGVYALGGGTVKLLPITYTLTAAIVTKPGVSIIGEGYAVAIASNVPEDSEVLWRGTLLQGDGTFIGLAGNAEDQTSATSIIAASGSTGARTAINHFSENAIQGVRYANFALKGFTTGMKVGAKNNYGLLRSHVENIAAFECSVWGMDFTNFQYSEFDHLYTKIGVGTSYNDGRGGIRFRVHVPSTVLIPGDSYASNLMAVTNYRLNRGIVVEVDPEYSNAMHNFRWGGRNQVNRLDADGTGAVYNSVTTVAGTTFTVANCEYFPVGMPVWFTSSTGTDFTYGNGLNQLGAKQLYFVLSRSAASGAGDLTIGNRNNDTAVTTTAGGTYRLTTGGFPNIEANCKPDGASGITHCHFTAAAEGQYGPSVCLNQFIGSTFHITDVQANSVAHMVLRTASESIITSTSTTNKVKTDFDNGASDVTFFGYKSTATPVGPSGRGFWNGRQVTWRDPTVAGVANVAATKPYSASNGCQVQLVVTGAATGAICTVTLPTLPENYAYYCPAITPANAAAGALSGAAQVRAQGTLRATGFDLVADTALPNGTYLYNLRW